MKMMLIKWLTLLTLTAASPAAAQPGAPLPLAPATTVPPSSIPVSATADSNYIIGPGDSIEVKLLERADFNVTAKVSAEGAITIPLVGSVPASNRTAHTLSDEIKALLVKQGYFAAPNLSVTVVSYAARYATVLGAVTTPGLVPIDRSYRLSEILARVGGVRDTAADYVIVTPTRGTSRHLLINDIATGDESQDPVISPGDKIFAPPADLVYVSGQVKVPGTFPITPGMTVRMALSRSGGVTDVGSDRAVKITRAGKTVKPGLDTPVQAGDVVVVGERLF